MLKFNHAVLAIFSCFLWACAFIFSKVALRYAPPIQIAGIRIFISAILMLIITRRNSFKVLKGKEPYLILLAFLQTIYQFIAFIVGLSMINGSLGAFLVGLGPAVISLIVMLMIKEEKFNLNTLLAVIIGVFGITLMLILQYDANNIKFDYKLIIGILLLFSTNITGGFSTVLVRLKFKDVGVKDMQLTQYSLSFIIILLVSYLYEGPIDFKQIMNFNFISSLIVLGSITATAVSIWNYLTKQKDIKLTTLNLYKFLIPTLGAILSWIFDANDKFNWISLIGFFSSILAVIVAQRKSSK